MKYEPPLPSLMHAPENRESGSLSLECEAAGGTALCLATNLETEMRKQDDQCMKLETTIHIL